MLDEHKILILNFSYEPLQFCSAKRGIVMVLSGRAEKIEADGYMVRSPSLAFPLPTVIRVLRIVRRNYRKGLAFSKKNILRRDDYTCQYCGEREHPLTVDHVLPKSRGGKTTWTNIVVACKPCNLRKGNRTIHEADMQLFRKPSRPNFYFQPFLIPSGPQSHVESWLKYLPPAFANRNAVH